MREGHLPVFGLVRLKPRGAPARGSAGKGAYSHSTSVVCELRRRGSAAMSSPTHNGAAHPEIRLKRLHHSCSIALQRYGETANETCRITGRLRLLPVSRDKRLELFNQKKREDEAHAAYLKARNELLAAIECDPDAVTREDSKEAVNSRPRGKPRTPRLPKVG